ncbi:MAG: DinB family protein [Planctomycetota bacterium]
MMTTTADKFRAPEQDEYNEYYHRYVSKFAPQDFLPEFRGQSNLLRELFDSVDETELEKLHEPYTWTLKQVVGHLIDCERIFSTRLLRIAVGDETPIPGINQDIYVNNLDYKSVDMSALLDEFEALRTANSILANRLRPEDLNRRGVASGNEVSALANLYILGGHVIYHYEIMKQRLS